jgi:perosamine synthetase
VSNSINKTVIPHSRTTLEEADRRAVLETVNSGFITAGSKNREFRRKLGDYLKGEYIELFSSGAMALVTILSALEVGAGDEVLIPAYVCPSVYGAVKRSGARAIFYDNMKNSWISSFEEISGRVTERTRAIVVVHLFGIRFGDTEKLNSLGIPVIEDCAHALTPEINGKQISLNALCSFYSFNATKLLATGEGGAIMTNDGTFARKVRERCVDRGLSDMSCALGLSQLGRYGDFLKKREEIASIYFDRLGKIAGELKAYDSIYFRFPVFVGNDSKFLNSHVLYRKGVDTLIHNEVSGEVFPNAEDVYRRTISIPIYPSLTTQEIESIITETLKLYKTF